MRVSQFITGGTPVRWIVPSLLPRGMLGLVAGKPGHGKSLFLEHLALAIASGSKLFDHFNAQPGPVEGVQAILTQNWQLSPRNVQHDYTPLRGMVWCQCGRKAAGCPNHGHLYFRCQICRKHPVNAHALWREVRVALQRIFVAPDSLIEMLDTEIEDGETERQIGAKLDAVKKDTANLDRALERAMRMHLILDGYEAEKLEAEVTRIRKLRQERKQETTKLEQQLAKSRRSRISQLTIRDRCARYAASLGTLSDQDWVLILRELDLKIVIGPELPHKVHAMIPVQLAQDSEVVLQPSRTKAYQPHGR